MGIVKTPTLNLLMGDASLGRKTGVADTFVDQHKRIVNVLPSVDYSPSASTDRGKCANIWSRMDPARRPGGLSHLAGLTSIKCCRIFSGGVYGLFGPAKGYIYIYI